MLNTGDGYNAFKFHLTIWVLKNILKVCFGLSDWIDKQGPSSERNLNQFKTDGSQQRSFGSKRQVSNIHVSHRLLIIYTFEIDILFTCTQCVTDWRLKDSLKFNGFVQIVTINVINELIQEEHANREIQSESIIMWR